MRVSTSEGHALSERLRSKLIGIVLISVSAIVLIVSVYIAVTYPSPIVFAAIAIVVLIWLVTSVIGSKLLLYESARPILLIELKRRVMKKVQKTRKPNYPTLIYLCGIDGAGKTTQISMLKTRLNLTGLKHRYVNLRWSAFMSYPLLAICRILGYTTWKTNPRSSTKYPLHQFYRNRAVAKTWTWLFTIDMLLHSLATVKIPIRTGSIVLCDRFIIDAMVDLVVETRNGQLHRSMVGRSLLSLIPSSSIIALLDLNENEAYNRKNDIPSLSYLADRRRLYIKLAKYLEIPIVSGQKSPINLNAEIVQRTLAHHPFWFILQAENSAQNLDVLMKTPTMPQNNRFR